MIFIECSGIQLMFQHLGNIEKSKMSQKVRQKPQNRSLLIIDQNFKLWNALLHYSSLDLIEVFLERIVRLNRGTGVCTPTLSISD